MSIQRFERRLTTVLEALLAAGTLGVFLVIITLVAMRYLFESGLVGTNEAATAAFVYLSSIGSAVAIGRGEHIRVDIVPKSLGRHGRRAFDVASLLLVGTLNAVIFERSLAWIAITGHTPMPATQLPRFVAQAAVPLGCGLAVIYCCTRIAAAFRTEPAA